MVSLTFLKLLLAVAVSLALEQWWKYGHSSSNRDQIIESCSNPIPGNCYSFCGDISTVDVNITTDDFHTVTEGSVNIDVKHTHYSNDQYCIADLLGGCAYKYWLLFKLVPVLLHIVGFLLQCLTWWHYKDFTPQQKQYDIIIAHLYPEKHDEAVAVAVTAGDKSSLDVIDDSKNCKDSDLFSSEPIPATTPQSVAPVAPVSVPTKGKVNYREMFRSLKKRPFDSVFALVEISTIIYVWGEVLFPPIYCDAVRPLSLYYYPILMSLLDLTKFNFYVASRLYMSKNYEKMLFSLLSVDIFVTNVWVTTVLAIVFLFGVLTECLVRVTWLLEAVLYRLFGCSTTSWPTHSFADTPGTCTDTNADGVSSAAVEMNPMVHVHISTDLHEEMA